MKLGTETGSMTNHILSRSVIGQPTPEVGMGVTVLGWTDRYAGTIVAMEGPGIIHVRLDRAERTDHNGMSESQVYRYTPDPNGTAYTFRMKKGGMWENVTRNPRTNRYNKLGGYGLRIGERAAYHDFSF
jgi:hypothetical protein